MDLNPHLVLRLLDVYDIDDIRTLYYDLDEECPVVVLSYGTLKHRVSLRSPGEDGKPRIIPHDLEAACYADGEWWILKTRVSKIKKQIEFQFRYVPRYNDAAALADILLEEDDCLLWRRRINVAFRAAYKRYLGKGDVPVLPKWKDLFLFSQSFQDRLYEHFDKKKKKATTSEWNITPSPTEIYC